MVISPNGFISSLDGTEDWISEVNWDEFVADAEKCNNFIVGRETYENVMAQEDSSNFEVVAARYKVIVTTQADFKVREGYVVVNTPEAALKFLADKNLPETFLAGGGKLNASFAQAGLIDEFEVTLEPYIVGQGRPVLAPGNFDFPLEFISVKQLSGGRVKICYRVGKK